MIIVIITISIILYKKGKINSKMIVFLIGSVFSAYSMCLSPYFPERAWFGVIVYFIIAIMFSYFQIINYGKLILIVMLDFVIIGLINFGSDYAKTALDINDLENVWKNRIEYMEIYKSHGINEIYLSPYTTSNSHNPIYLLTDLNLDYSKFPNKQIAEYYGFDKVYIKK